jgi:hypothetical protein
MTDWKALCAELVSAVENYDFDTGSLEQNWKALERAKAALAQSDPAGPTDEELDELWADIDGGGAIWAWQPYAREVLKRWGTTNLCPIPVAERLPTDEDLLSMADNSCLDRFFFRRKQDDGTTVDVNAWEASDDQLLAFAHAVLARWGR